MTAGILALIALHWIERSAFGMPALIVNIMGGA